MMSYTTQELSLQLPGQDLQDSTINILRLNDLGTSLVITRGALGDGETLRSHFEAQVAKLAKQVKDLRSSALQDVQVGPAQAIVALLERPVPGPVHSVSSSTCRSSALALPLRPG